MTVSCKVPGPPCTAEPCAAVPTLGFPVVKDCELVTEHRLTMKAAPYLLPCRRLWACAKVLVEEALIAAEARVVAEHCAVAKIGQARDSPAT